MVTRLRRYSQIADVLIKYGFGIALNELYPGSGVRGGFISRKLSRDGRSVYERIRLAIEDLGPTYVKFGQIMSTRREMLPQPLIDELLKLTDSVPPLPFETVKPIIEEYCGPVSLAFEYIEEEAIAGASLSQVHRAVLKDGSVVALKVQRPGISEVIETDLLILESMAKRAVRVFPYTAVYNPLGMVQEFTTQIRKELDFVRDGRNAEILRKNMSQLKGIRVPKVYREYSGHRLLTMEYIEGVRINDVDAIRAIGVSPVEIAERGFEAYIRQIFMDGFFHGDPHPGNLLVTAGGDLVFLDFGIVGVLRPERREVFTSMLLAIVEGDVDEVIRSFQDLGVEIRDEDLELIGDELYYSLNDFMGPDIGEYDMGRVIRQLPTILGRYHLIVPLSLMQVLKVIMMVLDTGLKLDPAFNFIEKVKPCLIDLIKQSMFSREAVKQASERMIDTVEGLISLPKMLNNTLKKLASGKIKLEIVDTDLIKLANSIERASDRILIGMVIAAIVVGSSVILLAAGVPITSMVYYLAIMGYGVALIAGVYSLYHVMRKND